MAIPRNRVRGHQIRSRGGSSRAPGPAQPPRRTSQTSCGDLEYNNGTHACSSGGGNSNRLPEAKSKLRSVPQERFHIAMSDQLGDGSSKKSEGTSRGARQRGAKAESAAMVADIFPHAAGGGFRSSGVVRIYCAVESISDSGSTEFQEVEKEVDAFMPQRGLPADHGIPMKQEDAEDSDSSSTAVDTSTSHGSSAYLSDSSIDHDLAEDYMSNIDQESCRGLLLSKGPQDQVPVECMSNPVTGGSLIENPRGRLRMKRLFLGESSGKGEQDHSCPVSLQANLKLKYLDVNCGNGFFCEGRSVATPDRDHNKTSLPNLQKWPVYSSKSHKEKRPPGLKKQLRRLRIEAVRKERAVKRGFDLCAINEVMENIVNKGVDMHFFQPMEDREREQVRKLASLYHLKSGSQGRGKKRFVVVTRTRHTCIPDGVSRDRLLELLPSLRAPRSNKGTDMGIRSRIKSSHLQEMDMGASRPRRKRNPEVSGKSMGMQPLSFVSSGLMETTGVALVDEWTASCPQTISETFGSFECHTKGFGSRIMAKMGFVEGCGLGKDGKGISSPIEPTRRPKSLGLGAPS